MLLDRLLSNWVAYNTARAVAAGGRTLRRDDLAASDLGRSSFGNVTVLLAPLAESGVAAAMAALDEFYRFTGGAETGTVLLFSPWATPDLAPYGWTLVAHDPLMLHAQGGTPPPDPPGLRITEVRDEAELRAFEQVILASFDSGDISTYAPGAVAPHEELTDERARFWVGWEGDQPVAAAGCFITAGINHVTLVGTVAGARGRGYGAAVTWRATQAEPTLPTLLVATTKGRPVYERLGYLPLFRFNVWVHERPERGADGDGSAVAT